MWIRLAKLLAGPTLEDDAGIQATLRPGRRLLEIGQIARRSQHAERIQLIGGQIFSIARRAVGDPPSRGAESRNRQPLGQVLEVVPGVELVLHRRRRLSQREEEAACAHASAYGNRFSRSSLAAPANRTCPCSST